MDPPPLLPGDRIVAVSTVRLVRRHVFRVFHSPQKCYLDVAFSTTLTCYLSLHPWVMLLDFLGFGSPVTACDDFPLEMAMAAPVVSVAEELPVFHETPGASSTTVTTVSVSSFALILDPPATTTTASKDDRLHHHHHLLCASAGNLWLHLTSHSRPVHAGGDLMHLEGRLGDLLVSRLQLAPFSAD